MDLFDTIRMIKSVETSSRPVGHFVKKYFNRETFDTKKIGVEVRKRGREAASFVSPLLDGVTVEGAGFAATEFEPAYIYEKIPTIAQQLLTRDQGEVIGGSKSPAERAADKLTDDLDTLGERIERRVELMAIESLCYGKQTIKGPGVDAVVDFGRDGSLVGTVAKKWSANDSDPFTDIDDWCAKVFAAGTHAATDVYMSREVASAFLARAKALNTLNDLRMIMGEIDPKTLERGVLHLGRLTRSNVNLFQHTDYVTENGKTREVFPTKQILVVAGGALRTFGFGVIQNLESKVETEMFPHSWPEPSGKKRWVSLESAPLAVPVEVDCTALVTVLQSIHHAE